MVGEKKTHFLKPCLTTSTDGSEAMLPRQNRSASSPPDLKALSLNVSFTGWRMANADFKSWATKMAALHKPTWKKAGIFEAVMACTPRIYKNDTDLVMGIAEKWCPDTKTFVFPWGEATITLEDVMVLLGFSVLGSPHFATLDSSGEMTKAKLKKAYWKLLEGKVGLVNQVRWVERFMNSGGELEHVAFLVLWLSYFVFPSCYYVIFKAMFPIAVHLSRGTRIALAPPVLAHLYRDLTLLKNYIRDFVIDDKIVLSSLFHLVHVWTWERFRELRPRPNLMVEEGEPRMARWSNLNQRRTSDVRKILENSKMDSFEWRPYTKTVPNWKLPRFYPEKAMSVRVDPNLDDELNSFARCIKVSELVGIDCVQHYFPNRVASQFGLRQDVPCPVNRNKVSKKGAWYEYNKPIDDDLTLYIPSRSAKPRFTPMFFEWWRKSSPGLQRHITGGDDKTSYVPSGSKRRKYMKRGREKGEITLGHSQTQVSSENDEEDDSLSIAQVMRLRKKKYSDVKNNGRDAFEEQLGKKSILEDSGPRQKLSWTRADGNEIAPPPEIEERNEETDEAGSKAGKNTVLSPLDEDNYSDPPKVLPLSQMLQKLEERFPKKLKRYRRRGTTENVRSASRQVLHGKFFQKDLVKRKSEHLGNKRAREDDDENCMDEEEEEEEEEEEAGSKAGKNTVLITGNENNSSDPLLGANGGAVEIIVSPPETRQNCDDEVDLSGVNAEKKRIMVGDGTKEAESLLYEDGQKQRSNEKEEDDDERSKQIKLAIYELASNLEARIMKVEKTSAKIRKWKTRRNDIKTGVSA